MRGHRDPILLRDYSTPQLIEELARRANERSVKRPPIWCHDCAHYLCWLDGATPSRRMPDDYNPCQKGHEMRFWVPEEIDGEYGHFLPVCADRVVIHNNEREGV